ncbi:MAG: SulP family inorganic anion transporter [Desulfovibrio sp.]
MNTVNIFREIQADFFSPKLLPALAIGLINGIVCVIVAVSFSAMIFSEALTPLAPRASGLIIFGAFIMNLMMVLFSRIKTNVSLPQDAPAATLTSAIPIGSALLVFSPNDAYMTMIGILFLSSLTTGISLWCIGRFKLANLFRFIPYPVVGGFLAGSGWLLCSGGIGVMCGISPNFSNLATFFSGAVIIKWLPAIIFALLLFVTMLHRSHFLILPCSLLTAGGLYYLGFSLSGTTVPQAQELGFLISGIPESGIWPAFSMDALQYIHWDVVFSQIPLALTVSLVTILCMLLNMTGVELSTGKDIDMNSEFKLTGISNMLIAVGGSSPGNVALSLTVLGVKTNANTRIAGLVTTLLLGGVLFLGGTIITYFPKPLLGALLFLLGLFFLWDWIVLSYKKMPRIDYALILAITATIVCMGFLEGVAAGIIATVLIFAIRFSRVSIIKDVKTLAENHSRKQRSIPDQFILQNEGEKARLYKLSGFLFFGSGTSLVEKLLADIRPGQNKPRMILLDFSEITGFDVSAVNNFQRLLQAGDNAMIPMHFSGCSAQFIQALKDICPEEILPKFHVSLDMALEQCEEDLIERRNKRIGTDNDSERTALFEMSSDAVMAKLEFMERFEHIVENAREHCTLATYSKGEPLCNCDESIPHTLLVLSGSATEETQHGERRRTIHAGDVLCPSAQFSQCRNKWSIIADTTVETLNITQAQRQTLASLLPETTRLLDQYIIEHVEEINA